MTVPVIDHYSFGRLIINGAVITSDVIIYPDGRVRDGWRRRRGHDLVPDDLIPLWKEAPARLIIGTGASGRMTVSPALRERCRELETEMDVYPTGTAIERFKRADLTAAATAACFHLTC
jgi:hypothetical protein